MVRVTRPGGSIVMGNWIPGDPTLEKNSFARDTYIFKFPGAPSAFVAEFRNYYGPMMNAFAAAEQNGKSADLQRELEAVFERENKSQAKDTTSIPATFLKVRVGLNAEHLRCETLHEGKRAELRDEANDAVGVSPARYPHLLHSANMR